MVGERPIPERITAAAMELVAERGMSGVTMSAVAKRAGVARQTVYNHFPDVDEIILAAHEQHSVMDQARLLASTAETAPEQIDLLIRHAVAAHGARAGVVVVEQGLAPDAREALHRHALEGRRLITSILTDGIERGAFRSDLDPDIDAHLIQGMLASAGEAAAEHGADAHRIASATSRTILAGLAARSHAPDN